MESYRNVIIGSGYAGKAMAWHLAQQGESTICIERSHLGGACPNVACLPTKNVIRSAKAAAFVRKAAHFGISDERLVGYAIYSHPEVASVGFTEDQLKRAGTSYVTVVDDWLASARAMASRLDYPRTKLLVSPVDYSILGCHLIGPEASTLLHQVLTVMRLKNDVRELAEMIYIHPALNECLLDAAAQASSLITKAKGRSLFFIEDPDAAFSDPIRLSKSGTLP